MLKLVDARDAPEGACAECGAAFKVGFVRLMLRLDNGALLCPKCVAHARRLLRHHGA